MNSAQSASGALPATPEHPPTTPPRRWAITGRSLPNLIVFALLAGVMLLGHETGWRMPKVSELFGARSAAPADWCAEHLVPESQCVECQPDLMPKPKEYGFCRTHGVAECVICHPDLAQVNDTPKQPSYDTAAPLAAMARGENNSRNT